VKTHNSSFAWRIRGGVLVLAFAATVALAWGLHARTSSNQSASSSEQSHNEISQMASYTKQGRYDDAVQLGLDLLKNDPTDEIVYQQIADVYFVRAQKDRDQREEWVTKAISYIEKSLTFNSKDKDTAGVHLFQDARAFESAGDLSADKKCAYYDRARKLLEDRASRLEGDQVTLAGRTFPLEPLRKENDRVLTGVKDKATKAGCK
jgi:tetratricopeptide (TPR) repeat protein